MFSHESLANSQPEGHGSIIKAFPDDASSRVRTLVVVADRQLTCCNAFRWILRVNDTDLQRFIACTTHLRAFPREEPLLCRSRQPYTVLDPPAAPWSLPTSLETYDFGTQAAIEGLVGNGILRAIDVDKVLMHLNLTAPMPAFRHRLLQDLFCEDRIRDPKIIVWGRYRPRKVMLTRSSRKRSSPQYHSSDRPLGHDPHGPRYTNSLAYRTSASRVK